MILPCYITILSVVCEDVASQSASSYGRACLDICGPARWHAVGHGARGELLSSQFPVNYFSISEVEQFFPAFADEYGQFERSLGGAGKFWRFNRLHDYANKVCQCLGSLPYLHVSLAAGQTSSSFLPCSVSATA